MNQKLNAIFVFNKNFSKFYQIFEYSIQSSKLISTIQSISNQSIFFSNFETFTISKTNFIAKFLIYLFLFKCLLNNLISKIKCIRCKKMKLTN